MKTPALRAALRPTVLLLVPFALVPLFLAPGCGSAVWPPGADEGAPDSGNADIPDAGDTIIASDVERDGPVLQVSVEEFDFGQETVELAFHVRNDGDGTMRYVVASDVPWAAVRPSEGINTGQYDQIVVEVSRAGLPSGEHVGHVRVTTDDDQSHDVAVSLSVAPPVLELSTDALDFGSTAQVREFVLRNAGGGTLAYAITADVGWLIVEPDHGEVADQTDLIEVWMRRDPLVTGEHRAHLTVQADGAAAATVEVRAEKPLTSPQIVPWIEINSTYYGYYPPTALEQAVEGLLVWQRITDTAIVTTTPGNAPLYTELQQRVPGMQIIPGLKTSAHLGLDAFDQPDAWQLIAQDVSEMVAAAGVTRFVFENEGVLYGYWDGDYEIDFDLLRECLAYLPSDVEYIWYPGLLCYTPEHLARSLAICQAVEAELHPRFVHHGFDRPGWDEGDPSCHWRLDELAERPPMPIIYFGCWADCYWEYDDVEEILEDLDTYPEDYPEAIFYPGFYRWVEAAEAIATELSQDSPLP